MLVVGMRDRATAIVTVLSVVVISMVLDRRAECVLEDLGQDIFQVYWDITLLWGVSFLLEFSRKKGKEEIWGDWDGKRNCKKKKRTRKWRRSRRRL